MPAEIQQTTHADAAAEETSTGRGDTRRPLRLASMREQNAYELELEVSAGHFVFYVKTADGTHRTGAN